MAGIAIAPSSLIGVLPVGSLFYIGGKHKRRQFYILHYFIIRSDCSAYSGIAIYRQPSMVDATVKEIGSLLDTEEMERPGKRVPLKGKNRIFQCLFLLQRYRGLHSISFKRVNEMTDFVGTMGK